MGITKGLASLIIVTFNNLQYTKQCLESIFNKTTYQDFEIVVVDNASQDTTPKYLKELSQSHPELKVIFNQENEGFAQANNLGATAAAGEFLVFLNNDIVVTRNWLSRLLKHLEDPEIGLIGPVTNNASNEARIRITYDSLEEMEQFADEYTSKYPGKAFEITVLAFFCVAMRHQTFKAVGPLDESFGLGMFEDDDYAMRLREQGLKIMCAEDVYVHHWGGASFLKLDSYHYWKLFRANRQKFEEKWKVKWQPHHFRDAYLTEQVTQLTEWGYTLQWEVLFRDHHIETMGADIHRLQDKNQTLQAELAGIHESRAWKFVRFFWHIRMLFIPPESTRERIFQFFFGKSIKNLTLSIYRTSRDLFKRPPDQASPAIQPEQLDENEKPGRISVASHKAILLTTQFFDFDGQNPYIGGAERYLLELSKIIRKKGYDPVVYQSANREWAREFDQIPFIGLDTGGDNLALNYIFHEQIPARTPVIYLAFYLAAPRCTEKSIGISHGVYWDETSLSAELQKNQFDGILTPLFNLSKIVSVDTNTINWVRGTQPDLAHKFVYVPNFVDLTQFKPVATKSGGKISVLYPRRLYPPRGFWLVHDIVPEFISTYSNIEFQFVGQANQMEEFAIKKMTRRYQDTVKWQTLPMEEMHRAYQQADITLIPTLHSEGTSLSCLEAMASGNAVIATNIGGLTNLVISGYNGLLIEPTTAALREALHELCSDKTLRQDISNRAVEIAAAFSLDPWQAHWKKLLDNFLP